MKHVAILQSNYIPWKGYFDIIHDVDLFVFHDDLQYTKGDWRNRNRIKTPAGPKWLTIPVGTSENRLICEVGLPRSGWAGKHWEKLEQSYGRSPFFETYRTFFEDLFGRMEFDTLSELNRHLIEHISREFLGIETKFGDSRTYAPLGRKQDRVLDLLKKAGATTYVSGPAARAYIDEDRFTAENIEIVWKDYSGYPEYDQPHPPFAHDVTILDLLFCLGPDAPRYIWGWREEGERRIPRRE
jgi:hypothetical protein